MKSLKAVTWVFLLGGTLMLGGCGSASSSQSGSGSDFRVSGTFGAGISGHPGGRISGYQAKLTVGSKIVTDVIAVSADGYSRKLGTVTTSNFFIDIDPGKAWIIVFVDRSKIGSNMIVAKFRSQLLDTLRPAGTAVGVDLGTISMTASPTSDAAIASPSISFSDLLSAISMSPTDADFWGRLDDVSLRYVNPDVDNNGVLDILEGFTPYLDFHNRFQPRVGGSAVGMDDIKNAYLPDSTEFNYTGSGVMFEIAKSRFAVPASFEYRFSGTGGYTAQAYTDNPLYERYQFDVEIVQPTSGTYNYNIGGSIYTFSDIRVPTMSVATGFILPFVRFNVRDDQTVSGVSWKWMKHTESGWTLASSTEIGLVVATTGHVSVYVDGDNLTSNKVIGWDIPQDPTGTLSLGSANLEHLTASEAAAVSWNRLGHLGVSYDDLLGMRYFAF